MLRSIPVLPGVYLTVVQTDKFKTGCFSVNLIRPLCREEAAFNALLPNVLLRGTQQHPGMQQISAHLDTLYGASMCSLVRKKGEVQTVGFYADFLSDHLTPGGEPTLAPMVQFLGEALLHPELEQDCLREDYVQSEKCNLVNAIEASLNEKRAWAQKRLLSEMCSEEAYGVSRLGEVEDVQAITAEALTAHWRRILAESQIEVFYLGTENEATMLRLFRDALKELPRASSFSQPQTLVRRTAGALREIQETMDITQGKLCIGCRTGIVCTDELYPALVLLNAVFGSGTTSKLFVHVREERSLCYYANSALEKFKGLMLISSGIDCSNYETAKQAILEQLRACQRGEITQEELESARRHLDSLLRMQADAPGSLDDFYLGQALAGLDGSLEAFREAVALVTLDQVVCCAQKLSVDTIFFLKGVQA